MISSWLLGLESVVGDLAFVGTMVNWARRRNRKQILSNWETGTATPIVDDVLVRLSRADQASPSHLKQARIITNIIKRVVNTQAFYYLAVAARHPDSYLHREAKSFFQMLTCRTGKRSSRRGDSFLQF